MPVFEVNDMQESKMVDKKAKDERIGKIPEKINEEMAEPGRKTARKEAEFMQKEQHGLKEGIREGNQLDDDRIEKVSPAKRVELGNPGNDFQEDEKIIEREVRKGAILRGTDRPAGKVTQNIERQINEERKGNLVKVRKGEVIDPERPEDKGTTLDNEAGNAPEDQP